MPSISAWPPHPAQQGLIEAQAQSGPTGANCAFAYRITGALQPDRLVAAYRSALAHFDALHLVLDHRPDGPVWTASADLRVDVLLDPQPSLAPLAAARERAAARFRPDTGPLGAVHVQCSGPGEWIVIETFDHLVADGRAMALLHDRVAEHYDGSPAAQPSGSYRRLLQDAAARPAAHSAAYWESWYDGFTPVRLPPDPQASEEGRTVLRLVPDQAARLGRAAGLCRATLAAVTLAAHAHALARHTGTGDVATYLPADARTPEQAAVFGQVTILAPIRITHDWSMSVADHARHLTRRLLEMRPHLNVGIDVLDRVGAAQPLNNASTTAFVFQDRPPGPPALADVTVEPIDLPDLHQAGGLVTVAHRNPDGGLEVQLRTPPGSGLRQHLDSITATMAAFLEAFTDDAEHRLSEDVLLPADTAALIQQLAEPTTPYPGTPVERLIIAGLSRSDKVVLIEGDTEHRADALHAAVQTRSAALRSAGVGAHQFVLVEDATAFGRIASCLAVLQIGAVYVPVTAETPPAVREQIRVRTRAAASLTGDHVHLEPDGVTTTQYTHPASPDDPAYVIFTSGSTGQPKGVVVSRAALANLTHGEADRFDIRPDDRVLLIAPPTTDPWICHVISALLVGAILVAVDLRAHAPLAEQITTHRVTHAFLPAVLFTDLSDDDMPDLRMIATAGDRCRPTAVASYLARPDLLVFNIYGPTEATVTATVAQLTQPADPAPVGRPIRGLGARVVIDGAASAPLCIPGELVLSGIGLAIGYLDDPAGTAHRFRADPFRPGERWYVTGDRAWLGADGMLRVDGRLDRQVKIRGFRVEPDHLEAAARASKLCRDAHALAVPAPSRPADAHLRLYVTECESTEELLAALRATLPAHLVPADVITLDRLPRTDSSKVDEAKLLALISPPPASDSDETDPLTAVWHRVLGAWPRPGDDFFNVGGDSLQVLRLVREIRAAGLDLAPSDVYENRTFAALAAWLLQPTRATGGDRIPIGGMDGALGPSQRWFFQLNLPEPARWNQHHRIVFGRLPPADALRHALRELLRSTPILSAQLSNDTVRHRPGPSNSALRVHVDPLDDAALTRLVDDLHSAMDLTHGRLLHAAAIQERDGSGVLLLVAHHLVVDDWSWHLIEDRIRSVLINPHQPLPIDDGYIRFTAAIEHQRAAGAFRLDADTWRRVLANGATASRTHKPASLQRTSTNLAGDAKAIAARWSVPLAAVLLACLGHALAAQQPGDATIVDIERNGRTALPHLDLSNVVGWIALHHPLSVPHNAINAATAREIAAGLVAIPDTGLSYGALRWSGTDLGSQVGRFAVNIVDGTTPADALAAKELLAQLNRCLAPSTSPKNRLPYASTLVFRPTHDGGYGAELTFDPDQLPEREAAKLLQSLSTALSYADSQAHVLTGHSARQSFDGPIPASAMQQLMLRGAAARRGVYLPRQVLAFPALTGDSEAFLEKLSRLLGQLDPFRRRIAQADDQLIQHLGPATPVLIRHLPGGESRAQQWLDEPDEIDPVAALDGGELAAFTAFTSPDCPLLLGMQLHHAIMDGQSNHLLTTLLEALLRRQQTGTELDIPASITLSGRAVRKHISAELHAGSTARAGNLHYAPKGSTSVSAAESATLQPEEVTALIEWARQHRVDLRAVFGAAALALAYQHDQGQPVYLISNGRTPDIPETMTSLGMFWYFDPLIPVTDDLVGLAAQVFEAAAAPATRIRARAIQHWQAWCQPVGLSFNYLKVRPVGTGPRILTIGHRDRFHLPHQIEVVQHADRTSHIRWLAMSDQRSPQPRLTEYLALLRRTAADTR
jgi:amino acid adenylation domain-containing protein